MPLPRSFWRRASPNFPDHFEFIEVRPEIGRILSSAVTQDSPVKSFPIPVTYEDAGEGQIRVKIRPSDSWRINWFRIEKNQICWNRDGVTYKNPWDRIEESELPDWWSDFRARAWAKMDQREQEAAKSSAPDLNKE